MNIALANELALICHHLKADVWEVIDAAATKPFGFMPFYPGPGIGGHCIPIDPFYLSWKARLNGYEAKFIGLADEINRTMPEHVLRLLTDGLNEASRSVKGSRVLVMGVAYKRGVSDVRESPALEIVEALLHKGADVRYADPFVPSVAVGDDDAGRGSGRRRSVPVGRRGPGAHRPPRVRLPGARAPGPADRRRTKRDARHPGCRRPDHPALIGMVEIVFWGSALLVGYAYVGYPMLVWCAARLFPRPVRTAPITPPVTVLIAARNEADGIGAKIENCLGLDYPADRLEVVVVSDGSRMGPPMRCDSMPPDGRGVCDSWSCPPAAARRPP